MMYLKKSCMYLKKSEPSDWAKVEAWYQPKRVWDSPSEGEPKNLIHYYSPNNTWTQPDKVLAIGQPNRAWTLPARVYIT